MQDELLLELFLKHHRVCTDTRKVLPGDIFFALKGERFDGNQYAEQALDGGAAYAVIDDQSYARGERTILVDDVLKSLQLLARNYRRGHSATFIAITGSNGKTTTKELMRDALAQQFKTQATKGNFNNHIGVPLTLLGLHADTEMAIIEMGANHQGEIAELCSIAEPDFGLITNIGAAHLEGFGGMEGVKKGKGELFRFLEGHNRPAFVNTDLDHLSEIQPEQNILSYSQNDLGIEILKNAQHLAFTWNHAGARYIVRSQMTGAYNLPNFMAAIAVGRHFQVDPASITKALSNYLPANQRSQWLQTDNNRLILDAYNANPSSTSLALDNLAGMDGDRWFILGDMFELGESTDEAHQQIADQAAELQLDGYLVGEHYHKTPSKFPSFPSTKELGEYLKAHPLTNKIVLVKGSRGMKLESLLDRL